MTVAYKHLPTARLQAWLSHAQLAMVRIATSHHREPVIDGDARRRSLVGTSGPAHVLRLCSGLAVISASETSVLPRIGGMTLRSSPETFIWLFEWRGELLFRGRLVQY
jgi:hypothetical protein